MEAFTGEAMMLSIALGSLSSALLSIASGSLSSALVLTQAALMLLPPPPQLSVPSPRATKILASLTSSKSSRDPASPSRPFLPWLSTPWSLLIPLAHTAPAGCQPPKTCRPETGSASVLPELKSGCCSGGLVTWACRCHNSTSSSWGVNASLSSQSLLAPMNESFRAP